MRLTTLILPIFLLLPALGWAETSAYTSPAAITSPVASQSGGVMGAPPARGMAMEHPPPGLQQFHAPCFRPRPRRSVRIVLFILRVLLTLSATFALTALGIFLIRRSRPAR
jgi:hypothetical protein